MNVVDSSGWLEYFADGQNASVFAPIIEDIASLIVPTVSIYEVYKSFLRERDENEALKAAGTMMRGQIVELDAAISIEAARLSLKHKIPMADSIILATARAFNATLFTQDSDFRGLEDVEYIEK